MLPQILPKDKFEPFVALLQNGGGGLAPSRVVAPVAKGPNFAFASIGPDELGLIRMDYDITILPPKKFLHTQHQELLTFTGHGPKGVKVEITAEPTVLLGAHPYDLHGIATLDAAFAQDPSDPYYLAKRKAMKIIGLNIAGPYINEHQFMADMGTLEPPAGGFDLFLTDLGERYLVELGSPWGQQALKALGGLKPAGADDLKAKQDYDGRKAAAYPRKLPYDTRYLPELLDASYDSLLWDAVARRCFSCGTCTNVCPTCYCFDVFDRLNLDAASGSRQRTWDSCQLKGFAEVSGGENFREHRSSRLRHRMFRKGKYILERTGRLGCVGCGRCVKHCVAKISILEAFQQIASQVTET
jgi:sulfhydrogenase subunit beta (sulfur reductase)